MKTEEISVNEEVACGKLFTIEISCLFKIEIYKLELDVARLKISLRVVSLTKQRSRYTAKRNSPP